MPRLGPVLTSGTRCIHNPSCWVWHTRDGRRYPVCALTYTHLNNCIKYMRNRVVALAKLGQAHRAIYNEMILVALLFERDRRDNTRTNVRNYIELNPDLETGEIELDYDDALWQGALI